MLAASAPVFPTRIALAAGKLAAAAVCCDVAIAVAGGCGQFGRTAVALGVATQLVIVIVGADDAAAFAIVSKLTELTVAVLHLAL